MIDALVDGDAVKATVELRRLFEGVKTLVGFEKYFLGEIKRVLGVTNDGENDAVNAIAVTQVKLGKYAGIAGLDAENQLGIRGSVQGRRPIPQV